MFGLEPDHEVLWLEPPLTATVTKKTLEENQSTTTKLLGFGKCVDAGFPLIAARRHFG
jgi:hypothetical protein